MTLVFTSHQLYDGVDKYLKMQDFDVKKEEDHLSPQAVMYAASFQNSL